MAFDAEDTEMGEERPEFEENWDKFDAEVQSSSKKQQEVEEDDDTAAVGMPGALWPKKDVGDALFMDLMTKALEQKTAGNELFKSGMPNYAIEAYEKGLDVMSDCAEKTGVGGDGSNVSAVQVSDEFACKTEFDEMEVSLLLNRAVCYLKLEKYDEVLEDTTSALKIQPSNVKALYRRGLAKVRLKKFDAATEDFNEALKIEPKNRETQRELARLKERVAAKRSADKKKLGGALKKGAGLYGDVEEQRLRKKKLEAEEREKKKKRHAADNEKRVGEGLETRTFEEWKKAEEEQQKSEKKKLEAEERRIERERESKRRSANYVETIDDDDDLALLKDCKGYKVLADGRKTSYFTREPDEILKEASGPQKIIETNLHQKKTDKSGSGSAWNAAGTTFEERPQTTWVDERLRKHLANVEIDDAKITNVKKLNGEASILISRGKPRYVFDYSATLEWQATLQNETYKGSISLPELNSTVNDQKYEQGIKHNKHNVQSPELDALVSKLQDAIDIAITNFVAEYHQRVLR